MTSREDENTIYHKRSHSHEGSIGNLGNKAIKDQMDAVVNSFQFISWEMSIGELLA